MGFKLNLTNDEIKSAQGGNFSPLPAGTYGAVIYSNKQKTSKSSGNPMFEVEYKVVEGPTGIGRRLRAWYVLTGKGLFKLVELNKATGFPYPDKDTPAGEFEFPEADEYVGIKVNIAIERENYESVNDDGEDVTQTRNVVKRVNQYDEDKITDADDLPDENESDPFTF